MVKHFDTPQEKETYLSTIRKKALQEVDTIAQKQRFGLFNQPAPLAVSDNSYDHVINIPKNEQGKPVTQPRQFQTNPMKKGKIKSSYFQQMGFITIGDKYQDEYKLRKLDEMQKKSKIPKENPEFKYSDGYKLVVKAPYEHKTDFVKKEQNYRDQTGRVITKQRNPQTGPVIKELYKFPSHIKDEYNRYAQTITKAREENEKKMKDIPPFKSMDKEREYFNSLREIFYDDPNLKIKQKKELDLKIFNHETPFKYSNPPKIGYNKTIGKFQTYMEDPLKEVVRKSVDPDAKKEIFKLNNPNLLNRPTPSISFHPSNIKREMRRSLR